MAGGGKWADRHRARCAAPSHRARTTMGRFSITLVVLVAIAAMAVAEKASASEIEIVTQEYSYSHGVKRDVKIAIETRDIKGSEVGTAPANAKPKPAQTAKKPVTRPPTAAMPQTRHSTQKSSYWPYEMSEELTQQELMMILVIIVSSVALVGLLTASLWYLVHFTWLRIRERRLLATLFHPDIRAEKLEKAINTASSTMPVGLHPLALTQLRLVCTGEQTSKLLAASTSVSFDQVALTITGLPVSDDDSDTVTTFFQLLASLESLQCQAESLAAELAAVEVPSRWSQWFDTKRSLEQLNAWTKSLRQRHEQVAKTQLQVVKVLEQRHRDAVPIGESELAALLAALRQPPHHDNSQLSSPMKLGSPSESKDEFGFFLRAFGEINQQRQVQQRLEQAFTSANVAMETRVASPTSSTSHPGATATTANGKHTATLTATRMNGEWTRTLETMVDRADELEMTHLAEVQRAQYLLEDAKRESFCLLNSSPSALQSVVSLTDNLVAAGADRKLAVLTAAQIHSSHSNMQMLTSTLRSVFNDLRKGDIIKMEAKRLRHKERERHKRERIMAKFRAKQLLMEHKMEHQRAMEREQQQRARLQREQDAYDAYVKQTRHDRKQFVWAVTKLDVLIVLLVMGVVFFDKLSRQLDVLKPVCPSATDSTAGSWWPGASLSLLQCRIEYIVRVGGLLLAGIALFYVVSQLHLLATVLPVALAAALYHVRTEWLNMLIRLPVLLVLYGFNSIVLYLLNQSLSSPAAAQRQVKRRAALLYVGFPAASVLLSVIVSITIACDNPHVCVATAVDVTQRTFATLWEVARHAYHVA